jgi:Ribbon-helix-helix protein, copG family
MPEKTETIKIRCDGEFKSRLDVLAEKEGSNTSKFMRHAVETYDDNVWGTLQLLKKLVPLKPPEEPLELDFSDTDMFGG